MCCRVQHIKCELNAQFLCIIVIIKLQWVINLLLMIKSATGGHTHHYITLLSYRVCLTLYFVTTLLHGTDTSGVGYFLSPFKSHTEGTEEVKVRTWGEGVVGRGSVSVKMGNVRNMIKVSLLCQCGNSGRSLLFKALKFLIWSRRLLVHRHTLPCVPGLILRRALWFQRAQAGFPHWKTMSACTVKSDLLNVTSLFLHSLNPAFFSAYCFYS